MEQIIELFKHLKQVKEVIDLTKIEFSPYIR